MLDPEGVGEAMVAHPGAVEVRDLHLWEVSSGPRRSPPTCWSASRTTATSAAASVKGCRTSASARARNSAARPRRIRRCGHGRLLSVLVLGGIKDRVPGWAVALAAAILAAGAAFAMVEESYSAGSYAFTGGGDLLAPVAPLGGS